MSAAVASWEVPVPYSNWKSCCDDSLPGPSKIPIECSFSDACHLVKAVQNEAIANSIASVIGKREKCPQTIIICIQLKDQMVMHFNDAWEYRIYCLFRKFLDLEKLMWSLSTLGGAYSAMGDYDLKFTDRATEISIAQLHLATEWGDPVLVSRCKLYIGLAFAQKGLFKEAFTIVRWQYNLGKHLKSELLTACCRGVWMKIKAIQVIGTKALPSKK